MTSFQFSKRDTGLLLMIAREDAKERGRNHPGLQAQAFI